MLRRTVFVSRRMLSTKGSKKTKRIEAAEREARRSLPPKLPWYLHKAPPKWLTKFFTDKDRIQDVFEKADLARQLFKEKIPQVPIEHAVSRLRRLQLANEKQKWDSKHLPLVINHLMVNYGLKSPPNSPNKAPLTDETGAINNHGFSEVEQQAFAKTMARSIERSKNAQDDDISDFDFAFSGISSEIPTSPSSDGVAESSASSSTKGLVEQNILLQYTNPLEYKKYLAGLPEPPSGVPVTDFLEAKAEQILENEWKKQILLRFKEPSAPLLKRMKEMDEKKIPPPPELGARAVLALRREEKLDEAWKVFHDFTSLRNIWSPSLVEAGITVLGLRKKSERALSYFEMAEIKFGRNYSPLFYHPSMLACAQTRGTTPYTFRLYDRMTRVDNLAPNVATLNTVLKACSVLGDVVRAKAYWEEIVDKGGVVPDEECVLEMLNCYARGNRMLRAKVLRKENVKVVTFHDKALLAQAAGLTPPKVDATDEGKRLLRELEGIDPKNIDALEEGLRKNRELAMLGNPDEEDDEERHNALEDDLDDDVDPDVEQATKEFEEEHAEEALLPQGHTTFRPGYSPPSLPAITPGHKQAVYDNIIELVEGARKHYTEQEPAAKPVSSNAVTVSSGDAVVKAEEDLTNGERQEINIKEAMTLVKEVEARSGTPASLNLRVAQLRVVAEALRIKRAQDMYDALPEKNRLAKNTMIAMLCRAQRLEQAKGLLAEAVAQNDIDKLSVGPVIDALARAGQVDEAAQLYSTHKDLGILERHLRYMRVKLANEGKADLLPDDPNSWRSREHVSKQLRSLQHVSGSQLKTLNWLRSHARG